MPCDLLLANNTVLAGGNLYAARHKFTESQQTLPFLETQECGSEPQA